MDKINTLVAELELKLPLLVTKIKGLEQENDTLKAKIVQMNEEKQQLKETVQKYKEKYDALKVANTILGSDEDKCTYQRNRCLYSSTFLKYKDNG